jgi:hypothetical protein
MANLRFTRESLTRQHRFGLESSLDDVTSTAFFAQPDVIVFPAEVGAFTLAGQAATLPTYILHAEPGRFYFSGRHFNQPITPASTVKLVTLGDSIMEYANGAATATTLDGQADGEIHWVKARGKAGFVHENYYDPTARWIHSGSGWASAPLYNGAGQGRAGDWAKGVLRRLTAVINMDPDIVVLNVGTNFGPVEDGQDVATTTANIGLIVSTLTTAGIKVVIGTIRPRAVSSTGSSGTFNIEINAARNAQLEQISAYIRTLDNDSTVFVWDPVPDLLDPNPSTPLIAGSAYRWAVRDGVHLTPRGAFESSRSLELAIDRVLKDGTAFDADASVDNSITNGVLEGTGGTVGAGVSGDAPDSHSISNVSGASAIITAVSSVEADGWQLVISSTGGSSSASNTQVLRIGSPTVTVATEGWTSTTWVKLYAEVEVSNGAILGALHLNLMQSSTVRARGLGPTLSNRATEAFATQSWSGWIETYPQQVGAATTLTARMDVEPYIDRAGATVVKVKRWIMREVEDPHLTFPYDPTAPAALSLSGQPATLIFSGVNSLVADPGTFTCAGQDAALLRARRLNAEKGHFAAVNGSVLTDDTGAFLLDDSSAVLFVDEDPVSISVSVGYVLTAETRTYQLTGQDAGLAVQVPGAYVLIAEASALSLSGQDANLAAAGQVQLDAGSFVFAGQDAGLSRFLVPLDAEMGIFQLSGQTNAFRRDLFAEVGVFALSEIEVSLPTVRRRVYMQFGPLLRAPGRIYPGATVAINGIFKDEDSLPFDPMETTLHVVSPSGTRSAYVYGDGVVRRTGDGRYVCDVALTEPGRWYYQWEVLALDVTSIKEGNLLVQTTSHYEFSSQAYH